MIDFFVRLLVCALWGVAAYFALWLCGMPARPIGYAGAALLAVALWNLSFIMGKSIKEAPWA